MATKPKPPTETPVEPTPEAVEVSALPTTVILGGKERRFLVSARELMRLEQALPDVLPTAMDIEKVWDLVTVPSARLRVAYTWAFLERDGEDPGMEEVAGWLNFANQLEVGRALLGALVASLGDGPSERTTTPAPAD